MRFTGYGRRCTHTTTTTHRQCGSFLDPFLDHAVMCKVGPGVYRLHNTLAHKLREFAREAGCEAESEVVVPSLLRGEPGTAAAVEARLDLHVWAGGSWPLEQYIDVTTRHPWAQCYRQEALADTEQAATAPERRAEGQKQRRYAREANGVPVVVAVLGSWGRLSSSLGDFLDLMARRAAHARSDSGIHSFGRRRRWIEELAIAQQRCLHRQFATAMQADDCSSSTVHPTASTATAQAEPTPVPPQPLR